MTSGLPNLCELRDRRSWGLSEAPALHQVAGTGQRQPLGTHHVHSLFFNLPSEQSVSDVEPALEVRKGAHAAQLGVGL